jgi:hypothetical protein
MLRNVYYVGTRKNNSIIKFHFIEHND